MASVLVTGGTRGIGAGIVDTLVAHGFNVGFCGRSLRPETEARAQALSGTYGVKVRAYACDISDAASREALLDAFTADFGSLEVLVNNAGIAPKVRCDLLDMSEESFEELLRTNLQGPFFLTQSAARRMIAGAKTTEFRCIINIGSVSADYVSVNRGEYCLSKAGVAMATKLWAVRLADAQIPVYELRPGVIRSDMTAGVAEKYDKMIADGLTLQKRWGTPADVGRAVAALAAGSLAYSTGEVINIDGGLTVLRF